MLDRKRVAMELAKGKAPVEVSQELGISPSHLSQLMSDDTFCALLEQCKELVAVMEDDAGVAAIREELKQKRDDTWDEIEELASVALRDKVSVLGAAMKTSELLSIAAVANKALRRTESNRGLLVDQNATVVQLNIGNVLVNKGNIIQTTINSQNQVVAVGDQTIVNASKESIFSRLEAIKNAKLTQPQIPKNGELPAGLTTEDL